MKRSPRAYRCKTCLGKVTRGYDPSQDIIWLRTEIVRWIEGNLLEKWYGRLFVSIISVLIDCKGCY